MSHYKSNLRDIEFNLFEVFGRDDVLGQEPFAEVDGETARAILHEVDRLAREDLAASFDDSRPQPAGLRPATRRPRCPRPSRSATRPRWTRSGFRLEHPRGARRHPRPLEPEVGVGELVLGANPPICLYSAGPASRASCYRNGNERDKQIAQHMIDRRWGATMVLTEPDAGSDVGAGRTKATAQRRRHLAHRGRQALHHLAEHDLTENIVHLVLARPVASRASAARAPRACRCSSCRSSTSTSRPAS